MQKPESRGMAAALALCAAVGALPIKASGAATFVGGSITFNGNSDWPGGNDFATLPGSVSPLLANVSGSTSGGLVEGTAFVTGTISSGVTQSVVALDAQAIASVPTGYGGFVAINVATNDINFNQDPLQLAITHQATFSIQDNSDVTVEFNPIKETGAAIIGDQLLPGTYSIYFFVNALNFKGDPAPVVTTTLDWTLTLVWPCIADISPPGGNGTVNVDDLLTVINTWGSSGGPGGAGDITGNGVVNVDDLLAVINSWGSCD